MSARKYKPRQDIDTRLKPTGLEKTIVLPGAITKQMNAWFIPLVTNTKRIQVLVGGASSSKSYSTAQKYVYRCLMESGHRILVVRKVAKTLRQSVFKLITDVIIKWNQRPIVKYNQTDLYIKFIHNGNEIIFTGLDDVEKLKSIHGITDIWVEEASEITEADFNQLDLRLRGESEHKKTITLTLNPIDISHWIKSRFFDRSEPDCITHHSTYINNQFLDKDTIDRLQAVEDPYYKAVYVNGEWGVFGHLVFHNYVVEDFSYDEDDLENVCNGLDFGFNHAQALVRCGFKDGELYVFDELYEKGMMNSQFIDAALEYFGDKLYGMHIVADSADPDKVNEWCDHGFNVTSAKKGEGSRRFGYEYLIGIKMHIHRTKCPNTAKEVRTFKRKEDQYGNVTDEFLEEKNDSIAALRYATEFIWSNVKKSYEPTFYSMADLGL